MEVLTEMKANRLIILMLSLCVLLSACLVKNSYEDVAVHQDDVCSSEDYMPIYFNDENQLVEVIANVREAKKSTDKNEAIIAIDSKNAGYQEYSAQIDKCGLASVAQYYKPSSLLTGMSFSEIAVKQEYISFSYDIGSNGKSATFTWFREMSPEVAMNDLYGRGAISECELENKGIKYVFLEWPNPESGKSEGYTIHWAVGDMAFQASVPTGYTNEEMLKFCQWEIVMIKSK